MKVLSRWLALTLLALPQALIALEPAKSVFQYNCQTWSRQNGLPAHKISAIAQTGDGYLWLGTQNGLLRFDGVEFKAVPITLPQARGQNVRSLVRSRRGGLWFAITEGGFGHFDGHTFSAIEDDRWWSSAYAATVVLEAQDGSLWTGSHPGLGHWVKGDATRSFLGEATAGIVSSLCENSLGEIWFGTVEQGLFKWADGRVFKYADEFLAKHLVNHLAVGPDGRIWVGTEAGLRCYDPGGQPIAVPAFNTEVTALLIDRHETLWIGTSDRGLVRYQNDSYQHLQKADGLGSDNVLALFEDAEGSLWVGTRDGLSQVTDPRFPIFTDKEGFGKGSCRSVTASRQGGLWVAGYGLGYFDGKTMKNYTDSSRLPNAYLKQGFEARNGDFYVVDGDKHVNVLTPQGTARRYPSDVWPSSFAEDSTSVLVAIGSAIHRIIDGEFQPYRYAAAEPPNFYWINNLSTARDGSIWIASNNGVFRLHDGHWQHWPAANGLAEKVFFLSEDGEGVIWAGLPTGVARIKDGRVTSVKPEHGLPADRIYAIVPDDHDALWMLCGRGILRIARSSLNDFLDGQTSKVSCQMFDGLESLKFSDRTDQEYSGCKTLDGRIWFPNPQGVVMIDPAHITTNKVPPRAHIDILRANGRELPPRAHLQVLPGRGELEFAFTGLSYIAPQKIQFRYQLEGYDKTWQEAGDRRVAFYTNLQPGSYTFQVMAANADGVWSKTAASATVTLLPHFYQTTWFQLLCGALVFATLSGPYLWRVRHLRRRQRTLQEARDLLQTEVLHRTQELAEANTSLQSEVREHQGTEAQLKQRTRALEGEIEERNRMQLEIARVHRELLETSRQAGMAEVATSVLHNVGNVLNSVNVSWTVICDRVRKSRVASLARTAGLLREHAGDLPRYLTQDETGQKLPDYVGKLSERLTAEQAAILDELHSLGQNIAHIKEIVAMQQSHARVGGVRETLDLADLVEEALAIEAAALADEHVEVVREFTEVPAISVEKHKVLQILVNLVCNARQAVGEARPAKPQLTIHLGSDEEQATISVTDNGVGIPSENLTRIFGHGFTSKKDGHGFGLHSGALAAKLMKGSLVAQSDGPGCGSTFTLALPLKQIAEPPSLPRKASLSSQPEMKRLSTFETAPAA